MPPLGLYIEKESPVYLRMVIGSRPPEDRYSFDKNDITISELGNVIDLYLKSINPIV